MLLNVSAEAATTEHLSLLWVIPFVLILLSIAIIPLINSHFWEHNLWWIALGIFTVPMLVPLLFLLGPEIRELTFEKALEYVSFILLLASLYIISGGIHIGGTLSGSPTQNSIFLFTGSLLASIIGTTGASMLLIRPLLRANQNRKKQAHIVVFFIFLVSNIGGILTPLGDPPLFLGYLQGVPFEWTLNLFPHWAFTAGIVLGIFYLYDVRLYKKENPAGAKTVTGSRASLSLRAVKTELDVALHDLDIDGMVQRRKIQIGLLRRMKEKIAFASTEIERVLSEEMPLSKEPLYFRGKLNFILLAGVVFSIYMQGFLSTKFEWWPHFGPQETAMALLAVLSLLATPLTSTIRQENGFTFGPIKEVAFLFAGIFATMIPALAILEVRGGELGIREPFHFFWATGLLSSFLDNAPTYLTTLSLGKALDLPNNLGFVLRDGGHVSREVLLAISAGAVFMGANTYIGNGPNFMVRSIAESAGIKMPSFFGYMAYSGLVLIPVFVLVTLIFFL
ncbi:MAG: sodium:proton antiporter [Leptonema sp. (in: Bacteria)]|nr:sodium:proton antiporter [Leptonema sp. (in: bacteria)]